MFNIVNVCMKPLVPVIFGPICTNIIRNQSRNLLYTTKEPLAVDLAVQAVKSDVAYLGRKRRKPIFILLFFGLILKGLEN